MTRSRSSPRTAQQEGPSLAELVGAHIALATEFSGDKRTAIAKAIARSTAGISGSEGGIAVPPTIARSLLPDTRSVFPDSVQRTGVGFPASGAGAYGASVATGYSPFIADRARHTFGPLDMLNWWPVKNREYKFNVVSETSLADLSRFGGFNATFESVLETTVPSAQDARIAQQTFVQNRLLIQTTVSRDIWQDSESLERWLSYVAMAEIRNKLEIAVLFGASLGFQGAINEPCTITIGKGSTSSGQISAANLDAMYAALAEGCDRNAVWHCNKNTLQVLDQLNVSGQFPENLYFPAGTSPIGTPYATIKGKPVIPLPWSSAVGTVGDIWLIDWSAWVMTYLQMRPEASPLSFSVAIPDDSFHAGIKGLPENAIEQRASEHALFDRDELAILWKMRCDCRSLWNSQCTSYSGNVVGPAVVLQSR